MRINVPYFKSEKDVECGPRALQMVLSYFGKNLTLPEISQLERQIDTGLVWTLGIARAAKLAGLNSKVISMTNFSHDDEIDYYEKYKGDKGKIVLEELKKEIGELGVEVEERDLELTELLSFITRKSIPIVLINWYVISRKEGYSGHFVPLVGYDSENVLVHNPGIDRASPFMPLKKELFQKAWESKGTDKDIVIVYNA